MTTYWHQAYPRTMEQAREQRRALRSGKPPPPQPIDPRITIATTTSAHYGESPPPIEWSAWPQSATPDGSIVFSSISGLPLTASRAD